MRAYDFMVFFLALNSSFWIMEGLGIWSGPGSPGGQLMSYFTTGLITSVIGLLFVSLIVAWGGARIDPDIQTVLYIFIPAYLFLMGSGTTILSDLYIPKTILTFFDATQLVVLFIAVVQMVTHTSTEISG